MKRSKSSSRVLHLIFAIAALLASFTYFWMAIVRETSTRNIMMGIIWLVLALIWFLALYMAAKKVERERENSTESDIS